MTGKVARPCAEHRCPALVTGTDRYCPAHRRSFVAHNEKLKVYATSRWQRVRAMVLRRQPICKRCEQVPATEVHHIKNARLYPEFAYDLANLEGLCRACHLRETAEETHAKRHVKNN